MSNGASGRRWTRNGFVLGVEAGQHEAEIADIQESIDRLSDMLAEQQKLINNLSALTDECLGRVDSVEQSLGWWEARK